MNSITYSAPYTPGDDTNSAPKTSNGWANKSLPPLPPGENFTPTVEGAGYGSATKSSTSASSSEPLFSKIRRLMSRRNDSRPRRHKSQSHQVSKPETVDKGTQTEIPARPTGRPREARRSGRMQGSQGTQRKIDVSDTSGRPDYLSSRPSLTHSSQRHGSSDSSGGSIGHSPRNDANASKFAGKMETGAGDYPMVSPNFSKGLAHLNQSKVTSLGTYESRYSDHTPAASPRGAIRRGNTMRRTNSDTSLILPASRSSSVLNANSAAHEEAGRDRHFKARKHQSPSEESLKERSVGRYHLRYNPSSDPSPSPLRREVQSSPMPSPDGIFPGGKMSASMAPMAPMAPMASPQLHRAPVEGYFELPEPDKTNAVPDHLHGSPLCPLSPKYFKGQQFQCPLHGRISWPTDASSDSNSLERFSEDKRNISDDLGETHYDVSGFYGPDHARGNPLCPAFNKGSPPGNRCLWHGKKTVVRSQIEDDM